MGERRRRGAATALVPLALLVVACGPRTERVVPTPGPTETAPGPSPEVRVSPTPILPVPSEPPAEPEDCVPGPRLAARGGVAPRIGGPLRACGTHLVDGEGRSVRLTSVGYSGMQFGPTGCETWQAPTAADMANMAAGGFNSVRLAISWANLEQVPPTFDGARAIHKYDARYVAALDAVVDGLTGRGLAVVLDMHQVRWSPAFTNLRIFGTDRPVCQGAGMPAWLYPSGGGITELVAAAREFFTARDRKLERWFTAAWTFVAKRYADRARVVGADILNEPYDLLASPYPGTEDLQPADLDLAGFYERVGRAIHAVNPRLLLLVEDNISRRSGLWALTRRPDLPNLVYAPHFYQFTWDAEGERRLARYHGRSVEWEIPIWLGEMTRFGIDPNWRSSLQHLLPYCRDRNIGWAIWSYKPKWFTGGSVQPGILDVLRAGF